ncbi:SGNH/GDSL hydrolase family protein [Gemmata sp. JC717]|uniref:SGNH/GDSL hydrolase family protein n=1 Tax=Gemmata algarum TaxID=2975278 RepID=UPI0021BA59C8|nr:SGNH/GDSL hydrolase family protein [Gemmata algarum]MDY3551385.1 SGNH/GDSL hydrolase family protein [Gemmata algarum]
MKLSRILTGLVHALILVAMLATAYPSQAFFLKGGAGRAVTPPATGFVTQRAPTVNDDSTKGYAAGMKWEFGGTVYNLTDPSPGAAVWQPMTGVTEYPLDDVPGAAVAWGTMKLRSAYSGPAVSVQSKANDRSITGITQANPAVVTYTGTDVFTNGASVVIFGVGGMTQLAANRRYLIKNVNTGAKTFELTDLAGVNIDSSAFSAYTSGGTARPYNPVDVNFATAALPFGTRNVVTTGAVSTALGGAAGTWERAYDQTGNGQDSTTAYSEGQLSFEYYPALDNGVLAIVANGPQENSRKMTSPNVAISDVRNVSHAAVQRFFFGNNNGVAYEIGVPSSARKVSVQMAANSGISGTQRTGLTSHQLFELYGTSGTDRVLRQNTVSRAFTGGTSGAAAGVAFGNGVGNGGTMGMNIQASITYNSTLSTADQDKLQASLIKAFGLKPQVLDTIVFYGDSLEQGNSLETGTTATAVYTTQIQSLITKPYRYQNLGQGGARASGASGLDFNAATVLPRAVITGAENILVMGAGSNDMASGTVTVATARDALLSIATKAKAAGYSKVYWHVIIPRKASLGTTEAAFETTRLQLNQEMRDAVGTNGLDGVIELPDSIYLLSNFTSAVTFDNVHLKSGANLIMAQAIADYINARHFAANDNFQPRFAANDNWLMADLLAGFGKRKEAA